MSAAEQAAKLEILVEELSAERALRRLMPWIAPGTEFAVRTYQGKHDLLRKLPGRMRGYAHWPDSPRVVVLVDCDRDDCHDLKQKLESMVADGGLLSLSSAGSDCTARVATRVAVHELESWFFGDVPAVVAAYPGVPATLAERALYREPDSIMNAWEQFERVLQGAGYHRSGLRKVEAASVVSVHMDVEANRSRSFCQFRDGVRRLVGLEVGK